MNDAGRLDLLQHFREEAREHAAAVSKALFFLETSPGDQALIADILRRTHSLKGTARVVGAVPIENLANAIETIIGEVRAGRLALGRKVMDALLEALDAVKAGVDPDQEAAGGEEVISRLLSLAASAQGLDDNLSRSLPGLPPDILEVLTEFQKSRLLFACDSGKTCWAAELSLPDAEVAARLAQLCAELKSIGEIVSLSGRRLLPEKASCFRFVIVTRLPEEKVTEAGSRLSLEFRNQALPMAPQAAPAAAPPTVSPEEAAAEEAFAKEVANLYQQYVAEAYDKPDDMARLILAVEKTPDDQERVNELFRAAHNLKGSGATFGLHAVSKLAHHMETVIGSLRDKTVKMSSRVTNALLKGADTLKELFSEARAGKLREDRPMPVLKELEDAITAEAAAEPARSVQVKTVSVPVESIRVRLSKLDRLVNLADELIISRNTRAAAVKDIEALAEESKSVLRSWHGLGESLRSAARYADDGSLGKYDASFAKLTRLREALEELWNRFGSTTVHSENVAAALQHDVMRIRMVPVSTLFDSAPRLIRDLTSDKVKQVELKVSGGETEFDKRVLELMADPLMHLLRNAVDHGIEPPAARLKAGKPPSGSIELSAEHRGSQVIIEVKDDGRGLDPRLLTAKALQKGLISAEEAEKILPEQAYAFIFHPGFSTRDVVTSVSGRGVGMDVVKNNVENLKGRIEIESRAGFGTTFSIHLPLSISVIQAVVVSSAGQNFCFQAGAIVEIVRAERADIQSEDGKACIRHRGSTVPVVHLSGLLGLKSETPPPERPVILVSKGIKGTIGFAVDAAVTEQTVVLKEICPPFRRVPHVAGGTILADGSVSIILDTASLTSAALTSGETWTQAGPGAPKTEAKKTILVVDDSLTTRELLRGLIESAGYSVAVARNGAEAWGLLGRKHFDLVVSDISMPEMDGYELTAKIRADSRFSRLPLVLVTALSKEEERQRGLRAGADAYLTKGAFDQNGLLGRIRELVK